MKVTWFGSEVFRIQTGGKIVVLYPVGATGEEARELVSGADMIIEGTEPLDLIDPITWRPDRPASALIEDCAAYVRLHQIHGGAGLLISAPGEPPLLLLRDAPPTIGRWLSEAVVILLNPSLQQTITALLQHFAPALVLVREADLPQIDFDQIASELDGTALQVLERGMGVEFG